MKEAVSANSYVKERELVLFLLCCLLVFVVVALSVYVSFSPFFCLFLLLLGWFVDVIASLRFSL